MSIIRTKSIVLRRTNYGEADRVLQLLTPSHGKLSVMAKGVRREKSKLAGGIELFALCDVTINLGKGELGILTSARLDTFFSHILEDYEKLQFGYEAIKHVSRATETVEDQAFFELLSVCLRSLNDSQIDQAVTKTWFYLQLAILLGVGMNLATDSNGMKLVEDASYNFSEPDGAFVFSDDGTFTSDHIKILRLLAARPPIVAMHVRGIKQHISDCLWVAERAVAH